MPGVFRYDYPGFFIVGGVLRQNIGGIVNRGEFEKDKTVVDELQKLFEQKHDFTLSEGEKLIIQKKREKGIEDSELLQFISFF